MLPPSTKEAVFNGAGLATIWGLLKVGDWAEAAAAASFFSYAAAGFVSLLLAAVYLVRIVRKVGEWAGWWRPRPKPRRPRRKTDPDTSDWSPL